ncbi:ATP-binding protein [Luteimonas kalidii]|uniref:histidine kinase n=1 Tax=Luteimonas kalidii TaxID=3042025 RepID=A0ABT6JR92_9GAMM|nr:ATP-binding protein [Luteimonas kalidii]MDH5832666.1 ATP-binding protein [Luteimonas kalidii]
MPHAATPPSPPDPIAADPRVAARATGDSAGVNNMRQLIQLRWIAVVGQLLTIVVVHAGLGIALPLGPMLAVLAALATFNALAMLRWRGRGRVTNTALLLGLLADVAALTAQLYLSGGIANPFAFLYLLQVVLAAVLLKPWSSWVIVALTSACVVGLALFPGPVTLPASPTGGLSDPYVFGLLLCFMLIATLLVVFITRIGRIIRARDARLAALRQRAAEEEHIVRMGLLASGAAHELGTPLSTLAVILGDWQHLPHFTSDPELLQDVSEMQAQVLRCKAIVSGILASAGETRGEAPRGTTLRAFLDDLVDEWNRSRSVRGFRYDDRIDQDVPIVADAGLQQMLWNILDNALEASRSRVTLEATRSGEAVVLRVRDDGPGFGAGMLERLGTPYQSSKGAPGRGLGLFLSVNVARTLGGTIEAGNEPGGGAVVTITLPLPALSLEREEDDGH